MLLCLSLSHQTAEFGFLEQLERHAPAVRAALAEHAAPTGHGRLPMHNSIVRGWVVLATCNRFEAYLDIHAPGPDGADPAETVIRAVCAAAGIGLDALKAASVVHRGKAVAKHLFSVSSGLKSVAVGEGEIAGQVRRAVQTAREAGTVTSDLERLFQDASRISRGVKNRTGIMTAGRSMIRLALTLAESRISDWAEAHVLLVGTGRYARASLSALRDRGVTNLSVHSPSGRAEAFALRHAATPVGADKLADALARADLIVTCTTTAGYALTRDLMTAALSDGAPALSDAARRRPDAAPRRLVIDLGLPRNVEPAVAGLRGVEVLDLETIRIHAPIEELNAADDAHEIVGAAAAEFAARTAEQAVTPALVALRKHVFDVMEAELERARSRGDASEQTEAALRHLVGVLLHRPSVRARELARGGNAQAVIDATAALFGIETGPVGMPDRVGDMKTSAANREATAS